MKRKEPQNCAVNSIVKSITRFEPHNLVFGEFVSYIDLLLCRNVAIYFTKPLQEFQKAV